MTINHLIAHRASAHYLIIFTYTVHQPPQAWFSYPSQQPACYAHVEGELSENCQNTPSHLRIFTKKTVSCRRGCFHTCPSPSLCEGTQGADFWSAESSFSNLTTVIFNSTCFICIFVRVWADFYVCEIAIGFAMCKVPGWADKQGRHIVLLTPGCSLICSFDQISS